MSAAKRVNFSPRNRANSDNDEYSLDGYDPNPLGPAPAFEQFPPYTHKPKPPAYPRSLSKGNYFALFEAPPRDLWYCEFPHCSTTFLPYVMWGTRHHCRACGITVCVHHCSHNLSLNSSILSAFEGDLADITTPILATSLDGTTLPEVVTLKYVCLLCSDRAVSMTVYDKKKQKKHAVANAEAEQLLLKLQAAQAELQAKSADVHSLTSSMHVVTTQMQGMRDTIHTLETQVNKNANKEYAKVQRLKQQLRVLNAENERALRKNNTRTSTATTSFTANTPSSLRSVSFDSTSDEHSLGNSNSSSDHYISDSDDSVVSTEYTINTPTTTAATPVSPMRAIDQLYRDIVNSAILTTNITTTTDTTSTANVATNTTPNITTSTTSASVVHTTTEATQTTPLGLLRPVDVHTNNNTNGTNSSAGGNRGAFSPATSTFTSNHHKYNHNTHSTSPSNTAGQYNSNSTVRPIHLTVNTTHTTINPTNSTDSAVNSVCTVRTPTLPHSQSLTLSTSPSPHHQAYSPPLTEITSHTVRTSYSGTSAWVDYTDIYDLQNSQDSMQSEVFDSDYPELRTVKSRSEDSHEFPEYSQNYKKTSFSATSATSATSGVSSGYVGGVGSTSSGEYSDLYEPDLLDVYGTRYSSVFNMLEGDLESVNLSPVDGSGHGVSPVHTNTSSGVTGSSVLNNSNRRGSSNRSSPVP